MAAPSAANTRVDQLAADVARIRGQIKAAVSPPGERPLFQVHGDGSVWNRDGVQVYPPPQAAGR